MRQKARAKELSGLVGALTTLVLASFVYAEVAGAALWVRVFHGVWLGLCALLLGYFLHSWRAAENENQTARGTLQ